MPSRRDQIRMTAAEVAEFLDSTRRLIMVTNGADGLPHPVPMNYGVDDEGRILVTSFATSLKIRHLERDARAALLVESGERYDELRAVILYTTAEIVRDPASVARLLPMIRSSETLVVPAGTRMDEQVRASIAKRVVVVFTPFRTVSWDHAKLGGLY